MRARSRRQWGNGNSPKMINFIGNVLFSFIGWMPFKVFEITFWMNNIIFVLTMRKKRVFFLSLALSLSLNDMNHTIRWRQSCFARRFTSNDKERISSIKVDKVFVGNQTLKTIFSLSKCLSSEWIEKKWHDY